MAELTVTAVAPVEVKVTDWVAGEFTLTLPKARLLALILNEGPLVPSCRLMDADAAPALAVSVAVWAELTAVTVAIKFVLIAPAATVTVEGTATAELLLARLTASPPLGAAEFSVTAQLSVPAPAIDVAAQFMAPKRLDEVTPAPLSAITVVPLLEALLSIVTWPAAVPAVCGENPTLKL